MTRPTTIHTIERKVSKYMDAIELWGIYQTWQDAVFHKEKIIEGLKICCPEKAKEFRVISRPLNSLYKILPSAVGNEDGVEYDF